ncbi:RmlC-like cupin [Exidia glandulosa HHB12029]|uniref:RmlC-like cupin n=2 Tax=Exidia glandulosa HHB12029 TaxID=1314781 RepID=A0A165BNY0_EXIGL|nr:RmlC-like cupin [Exidia glandulosa HHB12029]
MAAVLPSELQQAATQVQRISLLKDDADFVFNFIDPSKPLEVVGAGGHTTHAARDTFPALVGTGMAMTLGFLDACSINTPHTHPRATEFNLVMNGTLRAGFLAENGARFIMNDVPALSATIFPQGAIHFEANLGCEPVIFIAAFNNEDPGVLQIAQRFFGLPGSVIGASLGGLGVEEIEKLAGLIPDNIALGVKECFDHCGLKRPETQPTKQQQQRVGGNAFWE